MIDRAVAEASSKPPLEIVRNDDVDGATALPVVRIMEGEAPAPPALLVDDWLVDRDITLAGAPGGTGKSTLALALGMHVALGRAVFGTAAVRRSGPVLLIMPEDGTSVTRMVLDALQEGLGLGTTDRQILKERLVMVTDDYLVNLTRDTKRIQQAATDCEAVMVVCDPLRNLLGTADENDNSVAGIVCATLRRDVCWGAGAAVLLTHHSRKPGKDTAPDTAASVHDLRGAGGWANGSRLVLGVSKKQQRITVTGLKSNRVKSDLLHELDLSIDADPKNPARWHSCRITDANAGAARGMQSDAYTPGKGRPLNANEFTLLSGLNDSQEPDKRFSHAQWQGVAPGEGIKDETFKSVKNRLIDAHLASKIATGKKTRTGSPEYVYRITETGRSELAKGERVS